MIETLDNFLKNWQVNNIDKDELLSTIKSFAFTIAEKMGIRQNFDVQWKYSQNLFILGSFDTKTKTIFFNQNRIVALQKYEVKSEEKEFGKFIENFTTKFESLHCPDEADKSLYFTFTNKSKDIIHLLGDYEYIPFDISTTVLHELRHLYQTEQAELGEPFFDYLTKNNLRTLQKSFDPMCEPTEIDAIYFQLKFLKEYCCLNKLKDVFVKSYKLSVPELKKENIDSNMKFISNNAEINSTADNIEKLKAELKTIYDWQEEYISTQTKSG
jgi:hypothetical protein